MSTFSAKRDSENRYPDSFIIRTMIGAHNNSQNQLAIWFLPANFNETLRRYTIFVLFVARRTQAFIPLVEINIPHGTRKPVDATIFGKVVPSKGE